MEEVMSQHRLTVYVKDRDIPALNAVKQFCRETETSLSSLFAEMVLNHPWEQVADRMKQRATDRIHAWSPR
jgi:hypothetical protein